MYQILAFNSESNIPAMYTCYSSKSLIYQLDWIKENSPLVIHIKVYNINDKDHAMIPLLNLDMDK